MIYPVEVMASMTYEIDTDDPEAARDMAVQLFLSDVEKCLDIDTEVLEPREG